MRQSLPCGCKRYIYYCPEAMRLWRAYLNARDRLPYDGRNAEERALAEYWRHIVPPEYEVVEVAAGSPDRREMMPLLSADELAAIRARAETRVRLSTSADPDQIIWHDDQSAATVDDLRRLLGHIDALTAALAAERELADDLADKLLAALVPPGSSCPAAVIDQQFARYRAARQPQEATDALPDH